MKGHHPTGRTIALAVRRLVATMSVLALTGLLWLATGAPIGIDRWLDVTEPPTQAQAIVVLGGGTTGDNLPLPQRRERIATAAQLFRDGFAPSVIFSGGGPERVSESEVYTNAAAWLGIPRSALTNTVPSYQPSGKQYGDVLFRLAYRTFDFFIGLREVGAVVLS